MKFSTKQFLSVLMTLSLVWAFLGCAFLCVENGDCTEDVEVSFEHFASFDESSHEDSCPIKTSARMTTPERIVVEFDSSAVNSKDFAKFSMKSVIVHTFKFQPKFNPPPNITSQNKRPFVLRI